MNEFEFALGSTVRVIVSGEAGVVIGRADYTGSENVYLVRYQDGTGVAVERWWVASALKEVA